MDSFPDIPKPSSIKKNPTWRTLTATFGDGYEQFSPDGVNTKETEFGLTWSILDLIDYDTLETFLDTQTPTTAFNWTDPTTSNVETVRFVKDSFMATRENVNWVNISLKLKTVYGY
jgi:phage-related protein